MWLYLGLVLIALVVYLLTGNKYDYWTKMGVPTASGCEWFFGHYKPIFFVKKHMIELYDAMYKEFPDAPLVGYYIMSAPGLLVKDLNIIKSILVTEFTSFNINGFSVDRKEDILFGSNPFLLLGEEWKAARAHVSSALTLAKLKGYLPVMLNVGNEMVKYIKKNSTGLTVELETREISTKFTTDVIANAIYGIKNNTFEDRDSLIARLTRHIGFKASLKDNLIYILQQIPVLKMFFPARFSPKKLQDLMVSVTHKLIAERKTSDEKRNDVFQALMSLKENDTRGVFTVEYMTSQLFTIILDLYDTSSTAIALILYSLGRDPEIQDKLRSEIMNIKEKNNGETSIEDIEKAKYLDMVLCEFFRLYSFMLSKVCSQDCYLPIAGSEPLKVTKGTPIVIPLASIHKDPQFYPDPETFDPERFTDEEVAKRPKYSYMPFGEGPRKCMGIRIATLEIKVAVMKILENFKVKPSPKTKHPLKLDPKAYIGVYPRDGAWVIFEEIK